MKIRNGFVSNSSSSSFILVTSEEHWNSIKKDLHPYVAFVAEAVMDKPKNFCGMKVVTFSTWSNQGGSSFGDLRLAFDGDKGGIDDYYEAWEIALRALKKYPSKIFTHSVEM